LAVNHEMITGKSQTRKGFKKITQINTRIGRKYSRRLLVLVERLDF
jgi:hypothetical protein